MIYLHSLQSTGDIVRWAGHSSGVRNYNFGRKISYKIINLQDR
jgi:hypothetical protein